MNKKAQIVALTCALALVSQAADLSSSGDWTQDIGASDLMSGAGSDLTGQYESSSSATIQIVANTSGGAWKIKVRKVDQSWNGDLTIFVRRTSDGTGNGTILDGSGYVALSSMDTEIFSGTGDRSSISLQYKLTGMSKGISPSGYSTTILFTIE